MREIPSTGRAPNLFRLPVFEPDPALWSRIAAAHVRRRRARRAGFALAATVLLGVGAALLRPLQAPAPQWTEAQRESQALEAEWQRIADAGRPAPLGLSRLRSIDAALQAAYDRGADEQEIAPLWQRRNDALRGLIARFQDVDASDATLVTRI